MGGKEEAREGGWSKRGREGGMREGGGKEGCPICVSM